MSMTGEGGRWHAIHSLRKATAVKRKKPSHSDPKIPLSRLHHCVLWIPTSLKPIHLTKMGDTQTQWDYSINTPFPQMQSGMKKSQTKAYSYFAQVAHRATRQWQTAHSFDSVRMNIKATIVARWKTYVLWHVFEEKSNKIPSTWQSTLKGFLHQRL